MIRLILFILLSSITIKINAQTYVYSNADDGFLNIRALPTAKANIVGVLYNGKEGAELLDSSNKYWYKVNKDGIIGYVNKRYAKLVGTKEAPKTSQTITKVKTGTIKERFDKLVPGMTMQQCLDICGNPDDKSIRRYSSGENQSWFYYERRNGKRILNSLHFRDGKLSSIFTY